MNDIIADRSIMTALGRQLTAAVAKQSVSASNLANINTPNYRTREVSFDDALNKAVGTEKLAVTQPGHLRGPLESSDGSSSRVVRDTEGLAERRDGNNVELDRELLHMTRAASDFSAAQTALSAKFKLVRYAISESK